MPRAKREACLPRVAFDDLGSDACLQFRSGAACAIASRAAGIGSRASRDLGIGRVRMAGGTGAIGAYPSRPAPLRPRACAVRRPAA